MRDVLCRHTVTGHTARFPADTVQEWRDLGWEPVPDETQPQPQPQQRTEHAAAPAAPKTTRAARERAVTNEE